MKTIKKITLTAVLIIIAANVTLANNYRTHRMQTSTGKILEIISIIEAPVKEVIPGYESFVAELRNRRIVETKDLEIYTESEVTNDYPQYTINLAAEATDTYMATVSFINSINVSEEPVNDLTIDTRAIYEDLMEEKKRNQRNQALSLITENEEEPVEEYHFFPLLNIARVK